MRYSCTVPKKNRLRSNLYVQRSALSTTGSQLGALTIAAEMCRRESTQHTLAGQRLFRPRLADEKKSSGETTPGLLASACAQRPNPLAEHPNGFFEPAPFERCTPPEPETSNTTLEDKVRSEVLAACQRANWKLGGPRGAAARLGLKRTTLFYKMKRLGIAQPADVS